MCIDSDDLRIAGSATDELAAEQHFEVVQSSAAVGGRGSLGFTGAFTESPSSRTTIGEGLADMLLG